MNYPEGLGVAGVHHTKAAITLARNYVLRRHAVNHRLSVRTHGTIIELILRSRIMIAKIRGSRHSRFRHINLAASISSYWQARRFRIIEYDLDPTRHTPREG